MRRRELCLPPEAWTLLRADEPLADSLPEPRAASAARRPTFYVRTGKRVFDLAVAVTLLVVLAPLMLLTAALVRVFLGGPVLFRQQRPGRGGAVFELVKFRSMTDARDADGKPLPDARRITRFGRLLRASSLDELPELFNILRGEMSLVGPRPLLIRYLPYYTERERTRHDVRPGLTGWAQIHGRSNLPWDERFELDAWYVENCSFRLDLTILWRTVFKVLGCKDVVNDHPVKIDDFDQERRIRAMTTKIPDAPAAGGLQALTLEHDWQAVLDAAPAYDFYHLPAYHALAERRGEGSARLFVYREGDVTIALPLMLRPLNQEPWMPADQRDAMDATSVYGYAGPLASHEQPGAAVLDRFRAALQGTLRNMGVATVFSRLHPLLPQAPILVGLGECSAVGRTVSIDVTRSDDEILAGMHRSHRQDVQLLTRQGYKLLVDDRLEHLGTFMEIYNENMRRVSATPDYFFPADYFQTILADPAHARLMLLTKDDRVVCGSIFLVCNEIVQFHLSGTSQEYLTGSPIKLLLFEAARWGREQGRRVLHLGGGLGSKEDSLFKFKARFSDRRHDFRVWRWVIDPARYADLCSCRTAWDAAGQETDYFPAYRRPIASGREPSRPSERSPERQPTESRSGA